MSNFSSPQNIAFFAILASIGAFWTQLKSIFSKIFSFFIRTDEIENDWIGKHAFKILVADSKIIRWGNVSWVGQYNQYVKKFGIFFQFFYRKEKYIILIYKKIPIIVQKTSSGMSVTYLFTTFGFKKILEKAYINAAAEAKNEETNRTKQEFYLMEVSGEDARLSKGENGSPTSAAPASGSAGASLSLDYNYFFYDWLCDKGEYLAIQHSDIGEDTKRENQSYFWTGEALKLKEEVSFWKDNSNWFNNRGIVHRKGCILYGPPGSGKTHMVLQTAKALSIPVKKINVSNMSDQEFQNYYTRGPEKCLIILIEDIDAVFNLRTNTLAESSKTKNLLSFDTLLNTIGGIKRNDGIFLVITVNDFSKCDSALVRPGRCDIKLGVGALCSEGRRFIAQNILRDWPDMAEEVTMKTDGKTAAEVENYCVELAVEKFYSQKN